MIIHYHFSSNENSGEIKRIRNINRNLTFKIDSKVIEVAFIPIRQLSNKKFLLDKNIYKKYLFPLIPFPFSKTISSKLNSIWTSIIVSILCFRHKATFIIGEYSTASRSARLIPKWTKLIVDCHGATREEYEFNNPNFSKKYSKLLDQYENSSCNKAKCIVCQSEYMKKHLIEKYNVAETDKLFVYKCSADTNIFKFNPEIRNKKRNELNIKPTTHVFIYSGGLHKWQRVDDALQIFKEYHKTNIDSKFILLTLDKIHATNIVRTQFSDIQESVIIESVNHEAVPSFLNAADIAFLLRDNTTLNAVASPTKLAEYMACGLAVISTNVSKFWINTPKYIFNIEKQPLSSLYEFINSVKRIEIENYAKENLSIEKDNIEIQKLINYAKSK